jgi:short-subunit dehydrogenase
MKIEQCSVVITGATGGIGAAIAKKLSMLGAELLLVARNTENLKALQHQLLSETGKEHHYLSADITTKQGKVDIITKSNTLKVNMLINAAGVSDFSRFENITEQALIRAMNINLMAPIMLTQLFLAQGRDNTNSTKYVVNVGSALGSIGFSCYSSYCASKFGLRGFTESLQRELADSEDQVFYFAPRATATTINSDAVNEMNYALGNKVDIPEDVASALVKQLVKEKLRVTVGWPERLFVRLNGFIPELVDSALRKKLKKIKQHVKGNHAGENKYYEKGVDQFINQYFD